MTTTSPPSVDPAQSTRRGPPLWLAIVLLVGGVVLGFASVVLFVVPLVELARISPVDTPGTVQMHLHRGQYGVYELTDSGVAGRFTIITAASVHVVGTDGTEVAPYDILRSNPATVNHDMEVYAEAVRFRVPHGGDYDITVNSPRPDTIIVRRSVGDAVRSARGWLLGALGGALAFLLGAILLILALVGRSRHSRPAYAGGPAPGYAGGPWPGYAGGPGPGYAGGPWPGYAGGPPPGGPPPGWYADPALPNRRRYWDGRQWTEHVS